MSALNAPASRAMKRAGIGQDLTVHAATDVSGYGLLGHLYQVAKASEVTIEIRTEAIPLVRGAEQLAAGGIVTSGDGSNRHYVEPHLAVQTAVAPERLSVLLDPQTSGGLAIFAGEDRVEDLLGALRAEGVETMAIVGRVLPPVPPARILLR
jgi:selenide,water dikinase